MDDMLKESLEGFENLWQRVTCRQETPVEPRDTYSMEDMLLAFIHDETCTATAASALARMVQGDGRAALQRHAAEAKRRLRRLRAEYFILTGVPGGSNQDCRPLSGALPGLRTELLRAGDMAARYELAAKKTDDAALGEAFAAFAQDERRRARELRALIIGSF